MCACSSLPATQFLVFLVPVLLLAVCGAVGGVPATVVDGLTVTRAAPLLPLGILHLLFVRLLHCSQLGSVLFLHSVKLPLEFFEHGGQVAARLEGLALYLVDEQLERGRRVPCRDHVVQRSLQELWGRLYRQRSAGRLLRRRRHDVVSAAVIALLQRHLFAGGRYWRRRSGNSSSSGARIVGMCVRAGLTLCCRSRRGAGLILLSVALPSLLPSAGRVRVVLNIFFVRFGGCLLQSKDCYFI